MTRMYWEHTYKVAAGFFMPNMTRPKQDYTYWCPLPIALDKLLVMRRMGINCWLEKREQID